jgi:hypothetical protein
MECKHEWVNPYPQIREFWNIRKCVKCGVEGKILHCKTCKEDTVHIAIAFETRGSKDGFYNHSRDITTWKCSKCGTQKKTTQVWGSKEGWGIGGVHG